VGKVLENMAVCYKNLGDDDKAKKLEERAKKIKKNYAGQ
jgi:hypothetical protein